MRPFFLRSRITWLMSPIGARRDKAALPVGERPALLAGDQPGEGPVAINATAIASIPIAYLSRT